MVVANFGMKHNGKTYRGVKLITSFPLLRRYVNDVQREGQYQSENSITRFYGSMEQYIDLMIKESRRNGGGDSGFIVEEATLYLPVGISSAPIKEPLCGAIHDGNFFCLNFHSLRQFPMYIMDYTDRMIIGKSHGNYKHLSDKFQDYPQIMKAWLEVMNSNNPKAFKEVAI